MGLSCVGMLAGLSGGDLLLACSVYSDDFLQTGLGLTE